MLFSKAVADILEGIEAKVGRNETLRDFVLRELTTYPGEFIPSLAEKAANAVAKVSRFDVTIASGVKDPLKLIQEICWILVYTIRRIPRTYQLSDERVEDFAKNVGPLYVVIFSMAYLMAKTDGKVNTEILLSKIQESIKNEDRGKKLREWIAEMRTEDFGQTSIRLPRTRL